MDLRKFVIGSLAAFGVGFLSVLGPMSEGGLTQPELFSAIAAGLAALGLYMKDPNSHKGPDLR